MSSAAIAGLVLLLSATVVLGTGENGSSSECVSEQELAAVKADVERRVNQLHSQLHYWHNVTVNILNKSAGECSSGETKAAALQSTILNITQSHDDNIKAYLEKMNKTISRRLDSLEGSIAGINTTGQLCNTGSFCKPAENCSHIVHDHPETPSGDYWLQSSPGYAVKVFCDMERVCGCDVGRGEGGGWMRVADINMTRPYEDCPAWFRKITASDKSMCGGRGASCISTTFSLHGLQYSRVCGEIIGYQFSTPDVFQHWESIDNVFVDGIVLTHGYPRTHIWTFAASASQYITDRYACPCNSVSSTGSIPPYYVGNDYFCDSGHRYNTPAPATYLTNDPLWDGAGCVRGSCCTFNSPPWFCKTLAHPNTDDIELRLCVSEQLSNEDILFETVQLYVQ